MTQELSIILPLPEPYKHEKRLLPPELFPGGLKLFAPVALEHMTSLDDFVSDAFILIETYGLEVDNPAGDRYRRLIEKLVVQTHLEMMLHDFYHDFLWLTRSILGPDIHHFKHILSYRPIGGVCVTLVPVQATAFPNRPYR